MSNYIVAITDHVFPDIEPERQLLADLGVELRENQARTPEEVAEVIRGADAVLTCYAPVRAEAIAGLENCRIIARYGIGVDNVDVEAATAQGILVTNVPDYCIEEVSDHALAQLLALARKIVVANDAVRGGAWSIQGLRPVHRLRGQTLGLVALGQIARTLAPKAQGLGLRVIAHDPYVSAEQAEALGVELVDLDTLLAEADYVSAHAPLTDATREMFNREAFEKMKATAYLINTARGGLVNERDLVGALKEGLIAGAALDVLPTEPPPNDSRLFDAPNLILTPHSGFYSEESLRELQRRAAEEVANALRNLPPRSPVNPAVLDRD